MEMQNCFTFRFDAPQFKSPVPIIIISIYYSLVLCSFPIIVLLEFSYSNSKHGPQVIEYMKFNRFFPVIAKSGWVVDLHRFQ